MPDYDKSYKLMFSYPRMMSELLVGFVRQPWVADVDLNTLERVNSTFVSDDLREREDDIIWRVRFRGDWLYVYLLLEFQSTVDQLMALRIMVYVGLLYQDLVKTGAATVGSKLPPILPIVLYNGEQEWTAAEDMADLILQAPNGLAEYGPHLKYYLIEESRYSDEELKSLNTIVAAIFRLENNRTPEGAREVLDSLLDWLSAPEQAGLQRAITIWIERVWLPSKMPSEQLPPLRDLQEVRRMLTTRGRDWTTQLRCEGEAIILSRLMERRFGPLDERVRQLLDTASSDTLLEWADRVLTAQSIEEVLA